MMLTELALGALLAMTYTNAGDHYYSNTGPIQLAQVAAPEWLAVPQWPQTAPFNFSSGPIWTAVQNVDQELVEPNWIVAEAWSHYSLEPLTVTIYALHRKLLPLGEVYVFGWVTRTGGVEDSKDDPAWFELSDGAGVVTCYPTYRYRTERGQYLRVRGFCEVAGQLATDEYIVLDFRELP